METTDNNKFFSKIDWSAFWSATIAAFLVYFFTLGPSVGLEDSGELTTAADHLGVPHPPGYPFWSLCGWFFCRAFSWVKYMGQPTPAWAMSLFSAVSGALAAGCTAMLVCRSSADMLTRGGEEKNPSVGSISYAAGVASALIFAFSPVMWSQSVIVEIYALNALFLMWVFLLSYRWMRKPSDKILWLTAFVFGLGLTNYQVLLLAAVPLAIIIAFKNLRMFRDFLLLLIPVGLTYIVLKIGCMLKANRFMSAEVINKFDPVLKTSSCPNEIVLSLGLILIVLAPIVALFFKNRRKTAVGVGATGTVLIFLSSNVFAHAAVWSGPLETPIAPLMEPAKYAFIGALLAASVVSALGAAFSPEDESLKSKSNIRYLIASGVFGLIAMLVVGGISAAGADGYAGEPFSWTQPTLVTIAGVIALIALSITTPRGLAYAIPVSAVQLTVFILLQKGGMNGLTNPHSWWFTWPIFWNFILLALATVTLPYGRSASVALLLAEFGVSFYGYMPIVSNFNPPMNWGYPRTWEGFKHAIMRGQYEQIKMGDVLSAHFIKELGFYFKDIRLQFTLVLATLAFLPFAFWHISFRSKRIRAITIMAVLYVAVAVLVTIFSELIGGAGGEVPLRLDLLLIGVMFGIVISGIILWIINAIRKRLGKSPFLDFAYEFDRISIQWLLASGACFAVMSALLIALANTKGDVQDGFIQKVKFISSHGMFSMWIGYGLALGAMVAKTILPKIPTKIIAITVLLSALVPIYENYTNDRLVFELGSAEQNGHTFGWQFGNYQLRGANAIREELSRDEEPLPNPLYPDEMEPHAIFFGGTDPGRFVPTYMIYSADVRPDVYLITQNALADDTYMSVERDLYGDEIWIPSKEDSAESFNIYVSEVQSGKRNANAALKIENGRVQVTGALGVMEINGILTKMMFDHDRLRHAFYIEESYVIPWMYPYLAPHGLIMKIRRNPGIIERSNIVNDMEFWDWYSRRLLRDRAFRRDFPAQKSFSKLRAAIAGLYAKTGHSREADTAFSEAVRLYPASPEASFRYIQEILLPMRKWRQITDIIDYTDRVDPNNGRTRDMRDFINRMRAVTDEIAILSIRANQKDFSAQEGIRLAQDYLNVGQIQLAVKTVRNAVIAADGKDNFNILYLGAQILSQAGIRGDAAKIMRSAAEKITGSINPNYRRAMASILFDGGLTQDADTQLNEYLRVNANDVDAWMLECEIKDALGDTMAALNAIRQAYQVNPNEAARRIQANENLQRISAPLFRKQ